MKYRYPLLWFFLFLCSASFLFLWLSNWASPLYAVSEWVTAMERGDFRRAAEVSLWDGEKPSQGDLSRLSAALTKEPGWKERIYRQMERAAYALSKGEESPPSWFRLVRPPYALEMKVEIPSLYLVTVGEDWKNTALSFLPVLNQGDTRLSLPYRNGAYGPLFPIPQTIRMEKRTKWGLLSEERRIDYEKMWGERLLSFLPLTPYSSYTIKADPPGGTLWIDGQKAGVAEDSYETGPLPYESHLFELRKEYPWGEVRSRPVWLRPGEKEAHLTLDPATPELTKSLGRTIRDFLDSWVKAGSTGEVIAFSHAEDGFRGILERELEQAKPSRLAGGFVRFDLDAQSMKIEEKGNGEYRVSVEGREIDDQLRWVSPDGRMIKALPERSEWRFLLYFKPKEGWKVEDMIPLDGKKERGKLHPFHSLNYLRLATDAGYPPFEFWDRGVMTGYDVEFLSQFAEAENRAVTLTDMPYQEILQKMQTGGMDGIIAGIDASAVKVPDGFSLTAPYLLFQDKALAANPLFAGEGALTDKVKRIGIWENSNALSAMEKWKRKGKGREVTLYSSIEQGIEALRNGRIDLFLVDPDLLSPQEREGLLLLPWDLLPKREYVWMLAPGMEELLPDLNGAIRHFLTTPAASDLKRKYFRPPAKNP